MIPRVAKARLAEFCDVFCDRGAFTVAQARKVLATGLDFGLVRESTPSNSRAPEPRVSPLS